MAQGKVKWFDSQKGFGFIEQAEGPDLFVHFRAINTAGFKTLQENDIVEYNIASGPKGDSAVDVKVVSRSSAPEEKRPQSSYRTANSGRKNSSSKPFNRSIEDQLKALRKSSKENQQDLANRLKRR